MDMYDKYLPTKQDIAEKTLRPSNARRRQAENMRKLAEQKSKIDSIRAVEDPGYISLSIRGKYLVEHKLKNNALSKIELKVCPRCKQTLK